MMLNTSGRFEFGRTQPTRILCWLSCFDLIRTGAGRVVGIMDAQSPSGLEIQRAVFAVEALRNGRVIVWKLGNIVSD
jgi:hypothetical protein